MSTCAGRAALAINRTEVLASLPRTQATCGFFLRAEEGTAEIIRGYPLLKASILTNQIHTFPYR